MPTTSTPLLTHLSEQSELRRARGLQRRTQPTAGDLLDLAGNDYLGLLRHPLVIEGSRAAASSYGGGAGASRVVTGTTELHERLEGELTALTGARAGLVFSTGFHANLAAVTALGDADTLIVSDAHVHASLVDGCRLARGRVVVARHGDTDHVAQLLAARREPRALVVVESIYSVYGDAAPLAELVEVTRAAGATLLVDEAHGLGVAGAAGEGALAEAGCAGLDHVVVTATLSKALAAQGGVVMGHELVRDHLVSTARAFIYDTGLAPAAVGAALGALAALRAQPGLGASCRANAARIATEFGRPAPAGGVVALPMPGPREALAAVARAEDKGVRLGCFRPPSTPDGRSWLRLTTHADHSESDMARVVEVLREVMPGSC